MSFLQVDDNLMQNPKIVGLSDRAFRLYVGSLCFAARNLTDGHVTSRSLAILRAETSASKRHVDELVDRELWLRAAGGGFVIKDYLDYNRTAEQVKADRERARDRMRALRSSRARSGERAGNVRAHVRGPSPFPLESQELYGGDTVSRPQFGVRPRLVDELLPPEFSRVLDRVGGSD